MKNNLKQYGICPKSGIILNPFGQKPEWALLLAEKIRKQNLLTKAKEAML